MDDHLVFLVSTSGSVPSGRNAKAIARASVVRHRARPISAQGTFNTFSLTPDGDEKKTHRESADIHPIAVKQSRSSSKRQIAERQHAEDIPRVIGPQSIAIEELLTPATVRIRNNLASLLKREPTLVRDVLRCRHWAAASFALGTLRFTPEVHSAVKYLEHKVLAVARPEDPHDTELRKYGVALVELQRCLQDPERRMQPGVLAASHVLAICEMLGNTMGDGYLKFVSGIISLSNLQASKGDSSTRLHIRYNAGTILVEALLAKRYDAIVDQPWRQTILSAGSQGRLSRGDASTFADSADLIFSPRSPPVPELSQMTKDNKEQLINKARQLHSTLRKSIQNNFIPPSTAVFACPIAETVGERVAVMLGLDDFMFQMKGGGDDGSETIHNDHTNFYADVISAL